MRGQKEDLIRDIATHIYTSGWQATTAIKRVYSELFTAEENEKFNNLERIKRILDRKKDNDQELTLEIEKLLRLYKKEFKATEQLDTFNRLMEQYGLKVEWAKEELTVIDRTAPVYRSIKEDMPQYRTPKIDNIISMPIKIVKNDEKIPAFDKFITDWEEHCKELKEKAISKDESDDIRRKFRKEKISVQAFSLKKDFTPEYFNKFQALESKLELAIKISDSNYQKQVLSTNTNSEIKKDKIKEENKIVKIAIGVIVVVIAAIIVNVYTQITNRPIPEQLTTPDAGFCPSGLYFNQGNSTSFTVRYTNIGEKPGNFNLFINSDQIKCKTTKTYIKEYNQTCAIQEYTIRKDDMKSGGFEFILLLENKTNSPNTIRINTNLTCKYDIQIAVFSIQGQCKSIYTCCEYEKGNTGNSADNNYYLTGTF